MNRFEKVMMVVIPVVTCAGLALAISSLWVNALPMLRNASGVQFYTIVFILAVDGIFVPVVIGTIVIMELRNRTRWK